MFQLVYGFVNSGLYVGSLYLIPKDIQQLPREHHAHIRWRLFAATIATLLSLCSVLAIAGFDIGLTTRLIGLRIDSFLSVACRTCLLMSIFYAGPLVTHCLWAILSFFYHINYDGVTEKKRQSPASYISSLIRFIEMKQLQYTNIVFLRNIIVAPITEELVFRAVTIAGSTLISLNGANPHDQFFLSASFVCSINPIWFGLAHLHHLLDKLRSGIAWQKAIAMTLVQLMYTSIFGFIAAVFLVRTGSIAAPIISHMICNSVGLPDVSFLNKPRSEGSTELSCLYNLRYALLVIHFGGLVMFFYLLWQLTDIYVVGSAKEFNAYTNVLQFNTA